MSALEIGKIMGGTL